MTRTADGVGLGLSIAWSLVEAMAGELALASSSGEGSTFTVALATSPAVVVESARAMLRAV